jgi:predicted metalloprotease with PDZ domain
MKYLSCPIAIVLLLAGAAATWASPGPVPAPLPPPIAAPEDKPFPGVIRLAVDAVDTDRRIIRVRETVPVPSGSDMVLLYPKWLPGTHAPEGPIDRFAGLTVTASGAPVAWFRDPVDIYAFHVATPKGAAALDIEFQYLAPVDDTVGEAEISPAILILEWNAVVLYPAGYFTRQIPVEASVTLPAGWHFGTALETAATSGSATSFKRVPLETLVDSPLYAGRYYKQIDLDPKGPVPVHLDLFADRPGLLEAKAENLEAHRTLIREAYRLFGSHHYDHYDFLVSLSDQVQFQGLEHHRSSEDGTEPTYFTEWDKNIPERDLLPHEFTHSWNGKFRRPEDLWTPNYNVPMRDSLLWVYEGQTEYWGKVLAARSGLWTRQQALDELAVTAAYYQAVPGRAWRPLQDTTNDEIINPRRPMSWRSWQRYEDYYDEGLLIWLDADTLIREKSNGARSLDDFARAFFGIDSGSYTPVTYGFDDVVKALNAVQPYDWASFLRARLDLTGAAPLDGIARGGYRLSFAEEPTAYIKSLESLRKTAELNFSIGAVIDKDGKFKSVMWGGPCFAAGLTKGSQILAVNGAAYDPDVLKEAITAAKDPASPLELIVKDGDHFKVARLAYHGGLRYPRLVRDATSPARLDDIFAARSAHP